jgi:hypothetical protein
MQQDTKERPTPIYICGAWGPVGRICIACWYWHSTGTAWGSLWCVVRGVWHNLRLSRLSPFPLPTPLLTTGV